MAALHSEVTTSRPGASSVTAGMGGALQSSSMPRPSPRLIGRFTASGTLGRTFRIIAPASASMSGVGVLSVPLKIPHDGDFVGAGSLAAQIVPQHSRAAALSTTGTLAAPAYAQYARGSYGSGQGELVASSFVVFNREFVSDAVGTLASPAMAMFVRSAATSASGTLTASAGAAGAAYSVDVHFTAEGGLSLADSIDVALPGALDGNGALGILAATYGAKLPAPSSGSGVLVGDAVPAFAAASYGSGQGYTTATVGGSRGNAVLSAAGSLTAAVKASFKRAAALSTTGTLTASAVGRTFTDMGMNKTGTFNSAISTWTKVTGWAADTATYPDSVVAADGISPGGGTVNIAARVSYAYEYGVHQMRVCVDGVPIVTGTQNNYPGVGSGNGARYVTANASGVEIGGGLITVEFYTSTNFSNAHRVVESDTYLRVTEA